jgi:hypothetical protein
MLVAGPEVAHDDTDEVIVLLIQSHDRTEVLDVCDRGGLKRALLDNTRMMPVDVPRVHTESTRIVSSLWHCDLRTWNAQWARKFSQQNAQPFSAGARIDNAKQ